MSLPRVGALQTIVDTVGPDKNTIPGGNNNADPTLHFDGMTLYLTKIIFSELNKGESLKLDSVMH